MKIRVAAPHPHPHPFSPEHEPACGSGLHACLCVCAHMCVHYEADTSITYSSVLSAGLPHFVFQHASQSLCHIHYLTHTLTLMQIVTELFISDMLTYRLVWFSHRLQQITAPSPLPHGHALPPPYCRSYTEPAHKYTCTHIYSYN